MSFSSGPERKKITFEFSSGFEIPGILILALWILLIYSNTSVSPFVFDDKASILNNPHIRISEINIRSLLEAGFQGNAPNRPLPNITFALNYLFHQYDVFGYRLVNIAIHFVTAVLLYLFLKTTFSLLQIPESRSTCRWIALISTFLWAVHPLHIQSVTYIVQRMNSMAAMFYLLSMLLYVKGRCHRNEGAKTILYIGCLFSGLMAMMSKEIAATLPFFILLYEWYFFKNLSSSWLKRNLKIFVVLGIFLLFLLWIYVGNRPIELILKTYETRSFTPLERLLTESRVVIFYITLILFPHPYRLNLDHDFPVSSSILTPFTTFVAIIILVFLISFAIYSAKKDRFLSFSIIWFLGNLVLESSVIGLEIIFEHRTYLPSMMLIPMLILKTDQISKRKWTMLFGVVLLILVFSVWTYQRNIVWQSRITLWQDCLDKSPKSTRSHNNLALAFSEQGDFKKSVLHYTAALRMSPDSEIANNGLGLALAASGETGAAIHHFKQALNILPESSTLHYNLGKIYARLNRSGDAISEYYRVLAINSVHEMANGNLGFELVRQEQYSAAIYYYMRSVKINPNSFMHNNLGNLLFRMGAIDRSLYHYQKALQIKPLDSNLYSSYQIALEIKNHIDEAILLLKEELKDIDSSESVLPENMTDLKREGKRLYAAVKYYQSVLEKNDIYNQELFDMDNYIEFKQIEDQYDMFRSNVKVGRKDS